MYVAHIHAADLYPSVFPQCRELPFVNISSNDASPRCGKRQRARASNPLSRRGDERSLAVQVE